MLLAEVLGPESKNQPITVWRPLASRPRKASEYDTTFHLHLGPEEKAKDQPSTHCAGRRLVGLKGS